MSWQSVSVWNREWLVIGWDTALCYKIRHGYQSSVSLCTKLGWSSLGRNSKYWHGHYYPKTSCLINSMNLACSRLWISSRFPYPQIEDDNSSHLVALVWGESEVQAWRPIAQSCHGPNAQFILRVSHLPCNSQRSPVFLPWLSYMFVQGPFRKLYLIHLERVTRSSGRW